jgi:hypothetical protein
MSERHSPCGAPADDEDVAAATVVDDEVEVLLVAVAHPRSSVPTPNAASEKNV